MEDKDTILMIIDIQERLIKSIQNKDAIVFNISKLIDTVNLLSIPKFFSEQNPLKLGNTLGSLPRSQQDIIASKMNFSCINCGELNKLINSRNYKNLLLCGIETHVCVQQTAIDFINQGLNVFIAMDAVGSRNNLDHQVALRRIESAGGIISTTESIIFEWCKSAQRAEFRNLSEIIKRERPDT